MASQRKLAETRMVIRVSPSIENWKEKLLARTKGKEYSIADLFKPVVFFGLYRPKDWLTFMIHRGPRTVVWCGTDIVQTGLAFNILKRFHARHICENDVEQGVLRLMLQQEIEVQPLFFSDPHAFKVSYTQSRNPNVFLHINRSTQLSSGILTLSRVARRLPEITFHVYGSQWPQRLKNIVFHGYVDEKTFNKDIKKYQAALRLHEFDGFAETLGKSILLGQYPISRIRYPHIDSYKDDDELVELLRGLKHKEKPNHKARDYYLKQFVKPIYD